MLSRNCGYTAVVAVWVRGLWWGSTRLNITSDVLPQKVIKIYSKFYYFISDTATRLHRIKICSANYKVQKCGIQYRVYKVYNIRYNIQIPGNKT